MSESREPAQEKTSGAVAEQAEPQSQASEEGTQQVANPQAEKASREAARYRSKAKELEGQLEAATTLLNAARASIIENQNKTSGYMLAPEALKDVLADTDVSRFFTDDGAVDSKSFDAWAKAIVAERPYMSANQAPVIPTQADVPKEDRDNTSRFGAAVMSAY